MMWRKRKSEYYGKQLWLGARIEKREHNVRWPTAKKIAADHLREDPQYYKKLRRCRL